MAPVIPRSDRVVRRTAMVGAATAAYLLLTADYGPNYPNPISKIMESLALLLSQSDRNAAHETRQENSEPDTSK